MRRVGKREGRWADALAIAACAGADLWTSTQVALSCRVLSFALRIGLMRAFVFVGRIFQARTASCSARVVVDCCRYAMQTALSSVFASIHLVVLR
jgi:hypothetical protein